MKRFLLAVLLWPALATAHPGGYDEHDCHHQWATDADGRRYAVEYHCRPGTRYAEHGPWADRADFEAWLAARDAPDGWPGSAEYLAVWRAWVAEHRPAPGTWRYQTQGPGLACTLDVAWDEQGLIRYVHTYTTDISHGQAALPQCRWEE